MIRNRFLLLLALPLLLTGCTKDETAPQTPAADNTGGITFEIGFAGAPRNSQLRMVATAADFTSAFENGDQIGIFAVESGDDLAASGNPIHNVPLTCNNGTWSGAAYWPTGAAALDFYAYYPYSAEATDPTAIAFAVKADQSGVTDGKSNYNLSDLLTARSDNGGAGWAEGETVALKFTHMLAMVQFAIDESADGIDFNEEMTVTLRGVKTAAGVDLAGTATISGGAGNVTMHFAATDGTKRLYRALVPAQLVAAGTKLFRIANNGKSLTSDALTADLTLTAGKAELFTLSGGTAPEGTVLIPAAGKTFLMGSSDGSNIGDGAGTGLNTTPAEPNRGDNETQHKVTFTKSFYMSKYEITDTQYAAFLNAEGIGSDGKADVAGFGNQVLVYSGASRGVTYADGAWKAQAGYENHPVVNVTWYGAKAYADWVGGSLPTEAQWEFACRAGSSTAYSYGADADGDYMWYWNNSTEGTKAVGQKLPNAYGLYDMHGNVYEWCSDWYNVYLANIVTDPAGPTSGSDRVLRGGSWNDRAQNCRSAFRDYAVPDLYRSFVGFRVVFPAD